jgi:hypothetical protein
MKIKLTKYGRLVLDGKQRNCPHNNMSCGDWCALFTVNKWRDRPGTAVEVGVDIGLCHREFSIPIENFTDERDEREDVA